MPSQTTRKQRMGAGRRNSIANTCFRVHSHSHRVLSFLQLDKQRPKRFRRSERGYGLLFNFGLYASGLLGLQFRSFRLIHLRWEKLWLAKLGQPLRRRRRAYRDRCFQRKFFGNSLCRFRGVLCPGSHFPVHLNLLLLACKAKGDGDFHGRYRIYRSDCLGYCSLRFYVPNVAIPETISGLAVSAWTITA